MKTIHKRDIWLGAIVFLLALVVLFAVMPWAVSSPRVVPNLALSPTFWPRIILFSLAGLGIMLALRALRDANREGTAPTDDTDAGEDPHTEPFSDAPPFDRFDRKVVIAAGFMIVFCLVLETLGVVLPAAVLLVALVLLHSLDRWLIAIVVGVVTVVILYMFFRYVAGIPVPLGPLNGLL